MDGEDGVPKSRREVIKRAMTGGLGIASFGALSGCGQRTKEPTLIATETETAESAQTESPIPVQGEPKVGVFLGEDTKLVQWEEWFGRKIDFYSFSLFRNSWTDYWVENWPLEVDLSTLNDGRELSISFKMFPDGGDLWSVANGEYNEEYRTMATKMRDANVADAHLRFGWEFNGSWSVDGAVGRPRTYVRAWKQLVGAMRSVRGTQFKFIWAPDTWRRQLDPPQAYPGDEWVDEIGLTAYDKGPPYPYPDECDQACIRERRERAWQILRDGRKHGFGLNYWAEFAREHGKPLVFPEYSIVSTNWVNPGGGDNPYFFERMHEWMNQHSDVVSWHNVWSWTNGPHYIGPERLKIENMFEPAIDASERFRSLFAGE